MKAEIMDGNSLIAVFIGMKELPHRYFGNDDKIIPVHLLKYNCDWNELMPIVEKIAKDYDVRITWMPNALDVTYIDRPDVSSDDGEITSMGGMSAIENTWHCVVRFIKWHNTKSKNRNKINK